MSTKTKIINSVIFLLIFFIRIDKLAAQSREEKIQYLIEDAELYMEDGDYDKAYIAYEKLVKLEPNNPVHRFQQGMVCLKLSGKKEEAVDIFEELRKSQPDEKDVVYYLGRAYHRNYKFDVAIKCFDDYLASNSKNEKLMKEAQSYKANSIFGKELFLAELNVEIKRMGKPINSEAQERAPIITADESVMIFTYTGEKSTGGLMDEGFKPDPDGFYYEDIFYSKRNPDSSWSEPQSIGDNINSKRNDASIALSPDGQELYIFKSELKNEGDIFVCRLNGDKWGMPIKLNNNINSKKWEGSCSVTADNRYFYFSSERDGGFGGKDIYVSEKDSKGEWGPAVNMGPAINTSEDEDAPFIHPDGITLFFSSKGHKSLGGFDIMYSVKKDNQWISPINMGFPLNTTDDDRFYSLTAKGDKGYFSSNRDSREGQDNYDIYFVTPGVVGEKPVLAMILGNVYGNDEPLEATIEITKKSNGQKIGPYYTNSKSGRYLVALSPKEDYTFTIKSKTFPEYNEDINITDLKKFVELRKDFHLVKDGYQDPHNDTIKQINDMLGIQTTVETDTIKEKPHVNNNIDHMNADAEITALDEEEPCFQLAQIDFTALKNKSLNDPTIYKKLLEMAASLCCQGMKFKVQIGAYRHPENYKWDHLKDLGIPDQQAYPDGITRFTQGSFDYVTQAETMRQLAISKGQKDAWIVGFVAGKRYTLEELIGYDFFRKNISSINADLQFLRDFIVLK